MEYPTFDKIETFENCNVEILHNSKTGATSVGWKQNGRPVKAKSATWQFLSDGRFHCSNCGTVRPDVPFGDALYCNKCGCSMAKEPCPFCEDAETVCPECGKGVQNG